MENARHGHGENGSDQADSSSSSSSSAVMHVPHLRVQCYEVRGWTHPTPSRRPAPGHEQWPSAPRAGGGHHPLAGHLFRVSVCHHGAVTIPGFDDDDDVYYPEMMMMMMMTFITGRGEGQGKTKKERKLRKAKAEAWKRGLVARSCASTGRKEGEGVGRRAIATI